MGDRSPAFEAWRGRLGQPLLPIAVCLADVGLTLHGQPSSYWQGDYDSAIEGNPLARWFLEIHPLAFGAIVVGWIVCFSFLILVLTRGWSRLTYHAILFGPTVGATLWLLRVEAFGLICAGAFVLIVVVLDWVGDRMASVGA